MADQEAMAYELLDIENGDVLASYSTLEEARASLIKWVGKHPRAADHAAIAVVDASGHAVNTIPASAVREAGSSGR